QNLQIAKRDKYFTSTTYNQKSYYKIHLYLGTPAQKVGLLLDTGSSDLWVHSNIGEMNYSAELGLYNQAASSTWVKSKTPFEISYFDTTFASGVYGNDIVRLGTQSNFPQIKNMFMGLSQESNSSQAVMGIGLRNLVGYNNFPYRLKQSGYINKTLYSLYLNDTNSKTGSILFGAIDRSKVLDGLVTLPIVNPSSSKSKPTHFYVKMTSLSIENNRAKKILSSNNPNAIAPNSFVLLDSGTSLIHLPNIPKKFKLSQSIELVNLDSSYFLYRECSDLESAFSTKKLFFIFGKKVIDVHMLSLIGQLSNEDGVSYCRLSIIGNDQNKSILGASFLRYAYVLYNLDDLEISLGQANF
ncbi:pepsin-like aspartic protease, partial [Ascoidea rubescens DSM 1968]